MKILLSNKGSDWRPDDFDGILLYKTKECDWYRFSLIRFFTNIEEFLNGDIGTKELSYGFRSDNFLRPDVHIYGIKVFDHLKTYLLSIKNNNLAGEMDISGFHVLYDHAVMLEQAVRFLHDSDLLPISVKIMDQASELVKLTLMNRNKVLKIAISGQSTTIEKIIQTVEQIREIEESIFYQY